MSTQIDTTHWPKHPTKSGWLLKNKRGEDVRIVCVDGKCVGGSEGKQPLVSDEGNTYSVDGRFLWKGSDSDSDLIIPPDLYTKLRAAHKAGKVIQGIDLDGGWTDIESPDFRDPVECYRIKPEWTLGRSVNGFTLADSQEWHRQDWTEDMLPEGWRPLIEGERIQDGDYGISRGVIFFPHKICIGDLPEHHARTRHPLPTVKKMVPLGPEDVKCGNELRYKKGHFPPNMGTEWLSFSITAVAQNCVRAGTLMDYEKLFRDIEINRNDGKGWVACEKEETK